MNIEELRSVYFLGIGGIGMSALARYFLANGVKVAGYDRQESPITRDLINEGAEIHYTDDPGRIPSGCELAVRTPAVPDDLGEWQYLRGSGMPILKRAEVLGMLTAGNRLVAVAGTHGKTTTVSLITWLFSQSTAGFQSFCGGIMKNFRTNYLEKPDILSSKLFSIAEADEFDRSFLQLTPDIAVVTSMDSDHLDIYGNHLHLVESFHRFIRRIRPGGTLIYKYGLDLAPEGYPTIITYSYGFNDKADFRMENRQITGDAITFNLATPSGLLKGFRSVLRGRFNEENTIAAIASCLTAGISPETLRTALPFFQGVVRRFEYCIRRDDFLYIDDYAHHPEEIRACLSAIRELYPERRITAVFQPHLFSRTRDLADGFAMELSKADNVILLDIYPARERPVEGVTSEMILDRISLSGKYLSSKEGLIPLLKSLDPEVLVTLGAGDIDQLVPIITQAFV